MSARGFTLIELTGVLILISILAVSLWPRAPSRDSLTLNARADQLASDIRYVQTLSMTTGSRACLSLTSSAYSLTATDINDNCTATPVPQPAGLPQPIPLCTGTACVTWTGLSSNNVQFDWLGQPYSGSPPALLGSNGVVTLNGDSGAITVTISPTTGRVLVQ